MILMFERYREILYGNLVGSFGCLWTTGSYNSIITMGSIKKAETIVTAYGMCLVLGFHEAAQF